MVILDNKELQMIKIHMQKEKEKKTYRRYLRVLFDELPAFLAGAGPRQDTLNFRVLEYFVMEYCRHFWGNIPYSRREYRQAP